MNETIDEVVPEVENREYLFNNEYKKYVGRTNLRSAERRYNMSFSHSASKDFILSPK